MKFTIYGFLAKKEAEIDRTSTRTCYACMYQLYGLSEDEIKLFSNRRLRQIKALEKA